MVSVHLSLPAPALVTSRPLPATEPNNRVVGVLVCETTKGNQMANSPFIYPTSHKSESVTNRVTTNVELESGRQVTKCILFRN